MRWIRHNWLAIVVLLAIFASFWASDSESAHRDDAQHRQLVESCVRGSAKSALLAAYQHRTAEARRDAGDISIADDYEAFAKANIDIIPVPEGVTQGDPAIASVTREPMPGGYKFVLTGQAQQLQRSGCERTNA